MKGLTLRGYISSTPLNSIARRFHAKWWGLRGRSVPTPHLIKQRAIKAIAKQFDLKILVETGTYRGDMVDAMRSSFDQIYSIELSEILYERASKKFEKYSNIHLIKGDSAIELKTLLTKLECPVMFWLDGHYDGGITGKGEKETPISEEIKLILGHEIQGHAILIDDAHYFGTKIDYPTIDELKSYVLKKNPDLRFSVHDNLIRITKTKV